jgi:putative transposase
LRYEEVYLEGYADGREAHAGIAAWIAFYNGVAYCPIRLCH